ncbi:LysR family transcriptional regulator [Sinirhodobacter populi]|uniref:LysR family transcriptional regulator n=1 Tax=Paenirhodobacter populi TaxID=2306993 RepID=A0A443KNK0_9RHOB|nr:LysR substrate-binding domain-containing protein [Sinirhodobacter populi]RWR34492.1 LysR family transcriptional regulator [Sinirhodobacter populi]
MPQIPPLKALWAFDALGRAGSVALAAAELGVTPGAISQQVTRLGELLAVQLVARSGRGLVLTELGRLYHAEIRRGFAALEGAQDVLDRAREDAAIRLSCLTSVLMKWIGPRIFDWQSQHPGARLSLTGSDIEPDLIRGEADFRIYYGGRIHPAHHAVLFTDHVVPACAPELIAGHPLRDPADVLAFPLVSIVWNRRFAPGPEWSVWAERIGASAPESALSYSLSGSAIDAAVAGRGFVLAQISFIAEELRSGRLVVPFDIRLPLSEPYYLAWTEAALAKPDARALHRWLLATGRAQGIISAG